MVLAFAAFKSVDRHSFLCGKLYNTGADMLNGDYFSMWESGILLKAKTIQSMVLYIIK